MKTIDIAVVGVGGHGATNLDCLAKCLRDGERIAVLCDADRRFLEAAASSYPGVPTTLDYHAALGREDVTAVVISTPDHLHLGILRAALQRGLHVYVEKPLVHTSPDLRRIPWNLAKQVVSQFGIQMSRCPNFDRVESIVAGGQLGQISRIEIAVNRQWGLSSAPISSDVPSELNLHAWLGGQTQPEEWFGYHPREWRRFWAYGAGTLGDMGCHLFDLPKRVLGLHKPKVVRAVGPTPSLTWAPDWMDIEYVFESHQGKIEVAWSDGEPARRQVWDDTKSGVGIKWIGDKKELTCDYTRCVVDGSELPVLLATPGAHMEEWLSAMRGESATRAPLEYAAELTADVLVGVDAFRRSRSEKDATDANELRVEE